MDTITKLIFCIPQGILCIVILLISWASYHDASNAFANSNIVGGIAVCFFIPWSLAIIVITLRIINKIVTEGVDLAIDQQ